MYGPICPLERTEDDTLDPLPGTAYVDLVKQDRGLRIADSL